MRGPPRYARGMELGRLLEELTRAAEMFNAMSENLGKTMVTADTEKQARTRVENLLQTIAETAASLVSATSEILAGTTQQAAGAQEQAAAVAQTVTTVDEVGPTPAGMGLLLGSGMNIWVMDERTMTRGREIPVDTRPWTGLDQAPNGVVYGSVGTYVYEVNAENGAVIMRGGFPEWVLRVNAGVILTHLAAGTPK